jgi:hypothetical protein
MGNIFGYGEHKDLDGEHREAKAAKVGFLGVADAVDLLQVLDDLLHAALHDLRREKIQVTSF